MKKYLVFSLILHGIVVLFFAFSLNFSKKDQPLTPSPLIIDYVSIGDKTTAPKLSEDTKKKMKGEQSKKKNPEKEKAYSEPETVENPIPEPKDTKEKLVDKKEEKKVEEPKEEPKPIEPKEKKEPPKEDEKGLLKPKKTKKKEPLKKKPQKKVKPPKKKKASPQRALKNLQKRKEKSQSVRKNNSQSSLDNFLENEIGEEETSQEEGVRAEGVSDSITASEQDAIRQKIYKFWNPPIGVRGAEDMSVDIHIKTDAQGNVIFAEAQDTGRMSSDTMYRTAVEAALRAVRNPDAQPLPIPKGKEEFFEKEGILMTFNPKDLF